MTKNYSYIFNDSVINIPDITATGLLATTLAPVKSSLVSAVELLLLLLHHQPDSDDKNRSFV